MEVRPGNYSNWDKPIDSTRNWLSGAREEQAKSERKRLSGGFVVQFEKMVGSIWTCNN